jgi:hypothetical protein
MQAITRRAVEVLLLKDLTGDAYEYGIAAVTNNTSTGTSSVSIVNGNGSSKSGTTAFSITSGSYYRHSPEGQRSFSRI